MSDDGLESLAFAKRFKGWIATEVAAQLQRIAPRRRIAEVVSLDTVNRRAGVVYVGETNEVSLPYNLAVPAYIGQYVVVDGPPQDRSIVDVLGASGIEKQLQDDRAATPLPQYWEQQDLDILESLPMWFVPLSGGDTHSLATGTMTLLPYRATVDGTFSQAAINLSESGSTSNRITLALYLRTQNDSYTLLTQTTALVPATGLIQGTFESEVSVQRGDRLLLGAHVSGSGSAPATPAVRFLRTPLGVTPHSGYGMAYATVASVPTGLEPSQYPRYFDIAVWSALLR